MLEKLYKHDKWSHAHSLRIRNCAVKIGIFMQLSKAEIGNIFAYQTGKTIIIHRIVDRDEEIYIFRGDANRINDAAQIKRSQLIGKIVLTLDFFVPVVKMLGVLENKEIVLEKRNQETLIEKRRLI